MHPPDRDTTLDARVGQRREIAVLFPLRRPSDRSAVRSRGAVRTLARHDLFECARPHQRSGGRRVQFGRGSAGHPRRRLAPQAGTDTRGPRVQHQLARRPAPLRRPERTRAQQGPLAGVRRRKESRPSRGRLGLPTRSEWRSQQRQQRGRQSRDKRPTKRRHERRRPQPRPQLAAQVTGRIRLAPPDGKSGGERGDLSGTTGGTHGSTASQHLRRRRTALDLAVRFARRRQRGR